MSIRKCLVVAAHPDDEVLGCGGTIARLAREGCDIHIAILSEGITSRNASPIESRKELIEQLHAQSRAAARGLSAKEVISFNLPDNRFDAVPLLDIVKRVEDLVDGLRPDAIYTHHAGDLNIDHQITNRAVMTAARPLAASPVKDIFSFEVPSSTEWAFRQCGPAFCPNVFVDIGTTLEMKVQAMQLYESEARPFPHPRSPDALRTIARRWGVTVGFEAAEAFQLIRSLR